MVDITFKQFTIGVVLVAFTLISGCSDVNTTPVNINFDIQYSGKSISCENNASNKFALTDFRLYLHDIQLKDNQNQWHTVKLTKNSWQNGSTVLLDFENATNNCTSGDTPTNTQISGFGIKNPQGLRFTLGVPFDLNHKNPLIAEAPLNESTMHWHWQSGYKFMRAEFSFAHTTSIARRLHIGSLQCQGAVNNISHCEKPNRTTYTIESFNTNQAIAIKLDQLIDFIPPENPDKSLTCMGSTEHPWCANALEWVGLGEQNTNLFVGSYSQYIARDK